MKIPLLFLISIIFSCQAEPEEKSALSASETETGKELEVLMLGTFHFANFDPSQNLDVTQVNQVDVLSDQNQSELEHISNVITAFNPDKIFVEHPFQDQEYLDSVYTAFSPSDYSEEKRNETIQLAFRIGKKLQHEKMYAYDFRKAYFPYGAMLESIENAGQTKLMEEIEQRRAAYEKRYNTVVSANQSVTETLYFLNEPQNRKDDNAWYLNLANMAGNSEDSTGSFLASEWYRRNLMMYSHIQKTVSSEDERIMILSGASHIAMFKDFIDYNPTWKTLELKELMDMAEQK